MAIALSKESITASPGFNRWLIPPAALAIHLCIGQAYAFSIFRIPLTRILGITESAEGDWERTQVFWAFTIAIVFLGLSAAFLGKWAERVGPRISGLTSALCWSSGFLIAALGVYLHQIWLLYLGYGVVGGCGLGIGYITPVSTLIRWFPDRRGLATGMAIMGFGGGAMVASPLSEMLMSYYRGPDSTGVAETFVTLGLIYGLVMTCGAFGFRLPASTVGSERAKLTTEETVAAVHDSIDPDAALRTRSFYCLWVVLFLNVTAGIGILDVASPMIQEIFAKRIGPEAATGFVGLLSLFNLLGRFVWSALSDRLGRKPTYAIFLSLGPLLYLMLPLAGRISSVPLFVGFLAVIMSMYGGCFAAIPAYLSDVFGIRYVSAIHGRLLTAWSCAGIAGPAIINYIHKANLQVPDADPARAYDSALWLVGAVLSIGFVANLLVKPVAATLLSGQAKPASLATGSRTVTQLPQAQTWPWVSILLAWVAVGVPLLWGVSMTLRNALKLFF
jgi:MFS family permease